MILKWFNLPTIPNLGELKRLYKILVYANHPDRGGDLENMKEINNEYELAFDWVKKHPFEQKDEYSNKHHDIMDGYRDIIENLIHIPQEFLTIEICGSWIWISGDTKPVKDLIKQAGFHWASGKKKWYWKPDSYVRPAGHRTWDMERIRETYGSQRVANEPHQPIN